MRGGRVAIAQWTSTGDLASNWRKLASAVSAAKEQGAQLVALPEGSDFLALRPKERAWDCSTSLDGHWMTSVRDLSVSSGLWIIIGSFHEKSPNPQEDPRMRAVSVIVSPMNGDLEGIYRKEHICDIDMSWAGGPRINESRSTQPGSSDQGAVVVNTPIGRVGLGLCYDLRWQKHWMRLRQAGADVLSIPGAFPPSTGAAHWELLCRARAVDNQAWVLAPAQTGVNNDWRSSYGHAGMWSPWGESVVRFGAEEGVKVGLVDVDHSNRIRESIPLTE